MRTIDFGQLGHLTLEPARRALRLHPGIGGGLLELILKIGKSSDLKIDTPYQVDAAVFLSSSPGVGQQMLCQVRAEHLVTPAVHPTEVRLQGFITDEQLRVVEQIRNGGDLWVTLRFTVTSVELLTDTQAPRPAADVPLALPSGGEVVFDRPVLRRRDGDLRFDVGASEWAGQVEKVHAGAFVEVLVPLGQGEAYASAVGHLRKARELLRENKVDEALGHARQALEPVRDWYGTSGKASAARKREREAQTAEERNPRLRTLDERWAFMVEDLYGTLSGALHEDEVTKTFEFSRADGVTLVAAVAGMLGRMAEVQG